jgi:UDP-N-acetylmuramoyl-L-alanyl-D-glutamate--2,6-diaminopimelate ligase
MNHTTTPGSARPGRGAPAAGAESRPLPRLLEALPDAAFDERALPARVRGIRIASTTVEPGDLFVAVPGTARDGHDFLDDAAARGAVAAVVEHPPSQPIELPLIRVSDSRAAVARLAAAWHDRPGARIPLIGITGTVGKTSVLAMMERMLEESGGRPGSIGSLGVRFAGSERETGYTAPDALLLHAALRRIVDAGCRIGVMEVTSHGLVQERMHGLHFALGVFTNLVPFEHVDFHRTFREYAAAKARFLDLLAPDAPLVYNADDRAVRGVVRKRAGIRPVSCGASRRADARLELESFDTAGMLMRLHVRRPLPRLDGGTVEPRSIPLRLHLLGRTNASNAALAVTAALCAGAHFEAVMAALPAMQPPRRRMQVLRTEPFLVLDDTVGHPDSLSAVMEVARGLDYRRLHIVFGIRGSRGSRINRRLAEALAIWVEQMPAATLIITSSEDAADERNRVTPAEQEAFLGPLREAGVAFEHHAGLEHAVRKAVARVDDGDLLLLLGAQGMDRAGEIEERETEAAF